MKSSNTNIVQFPSCHAVLDIGLSNSLVKKISSNKAATLTKKHTGKMNKATDSEMFYSPWNKTKRLFG